MFDRLKKLARNFKRELTYYRLLAQHPRTPVAAKWLIGAAIFYACLPFDLIPDWLPVVGLLDDLILIPVLLVLAMRLIPEDVALSCRKKADYLNQPPNHN